MGFWEKAFRNILIGVMLGTFVGILYSFSPIVASESVVPGWKERAILITIFLALWGAAVGVGCTHTEQTSKAAKLRLVLLAMIVSVILVSGLVFSAPRPKNEKFYEILVFVLAMAGAAGLICGSVQFIEPPKSAGKAK